MNLVENQSKQKHLRLELLQKHFIGNLGLGLELKKIMEMVSM